VRADAGPVDPDPQRARRHHHGTVALKIAALLHAPPDALLLAVLVGASCDFLTPIGHENNLIVMEPGGYRFSDYSRLGAGMSALAVLTAAVVLSLQYG